MSSQCDVPAQPCKLPIVVQVGPHHRNLTVPIGWRLLSKEELIKPGDMCANLQHVAWEPVEDVDFIPYLDHGMILYTDDQGREHAQCDAAFYDYVIRQWGGFKAQLDFYKSRFEVSRALRVLDAQSERRRYGDTPDDVLPTEEARIAFYKRLNHTEVIAACVLNSLECWNIPVAIAQQVIDSIPDYKLEIMSSELYGGSPDQHCVVCGGKLHEDLHIFWRLLAESQFIMQYGLKD